MPPKSRSMMHWFAIILSSASALLAQPIHAQIEAGQESLEPQAPIALSVTEITDRAQATHLVLIKLRARFEILPAIKTIEEMLPTVLDSLAILRADAIYDNLDKLTIRRLDNLNQRWTLYLEQLNAWQNALQRRAQDLEDQDKKLEEMSTIWKITAEASVAEEVPESIRERLKSINDEIAETAAALRQRMAVLLTLSDSISDGQIEITELIDRINSTRTERQGQLFVRDSEPLWEAMRARTDSSEIGRQFRDSWAEILQTNLIFVRTNRERFYLHMLIFAALLGLVIFLRNRARHDQMLDENDETLKASMFFVSRPFSAALLIALILTVWIYPNRPAAVGEFVLLLLLAPVLRLVPGIIMPAMRKPAYYLAVLFVLVLLQRFAAEYLLLRRWILLLVTILATALLLWLISSKSPLRQLQSRAGLLRWLFPVLLLALLVSFVANLIGSAALAHRLTVSIVESATIAMILYAAAGVLGSLVVLLIRKRRAQDSRFVQVYGERVERRLLFGIHFIAVLLWLNVTLRRSGFLPIVQNWFATIAEQEWTFGTVQISVGSIVDFLLIVVFAFILARLVRLILEMEIFPRLHLPRGVPGAITMIIRYTIGGLGIFLALSTLGLDLGKFGLLAGALGVGLGFGLRNIIENFVSGLILAFERPIQVGDTVELGDMMGNVTQIGIRSSTVKTFDGSEVIVPNADLISNKVTNWTLSDYRRRVQLPVKVAYGSEPQQVLDLLLKIAQDHPGVLRDPEPLASFNGFGENYLDFTLYYWVSENILQTKSEVALGVHDAIKQAGIDMPRPQREINLNLVNSADLKQVLSKEP